MRDVAIIGSGMIPCKSRWLNKTHWELAQWATAEAVKDARITVDDVDAGTIGIYNDIFQFQAIPESGLQGIIGLANKALPRVSNGGATGAYAMQVAYALIASGLYDCLLVVGVEKALDCYDFEAEGATPAVVQTIGYSWDPWYERLIGSHAAESYAHVARAYMDRHKDDLAPEARASLTVLLSEQARNNPYAQRHEDVTPEQVIHSRYVVKPIRALETCVYTEGACALVLASRDFVEAHGLNKGSMVWIAGIGAANEPYFVGRDPSRYKVLHRIYSDYIATQQALRMAGISVNEVGVLEVHDAFILQLMITLAEMGIVPLGRANDLVNDGIVMPGGKLLVNPSGGLTFGGHFVGGSNMMSAWSARREMLARGIEYGLVHGTGSSLSAYGVAFILRQRR